MIAENSFQEPGNQPPILIQTQVLFGCCEPKVTLFCHFLSGPFFQSFVFFPTKAVMYSYNSISKRIHSESIPPPLSPSTQVPLQGSAHQHCLPEQQENLFHGEVRRMATAKFGHHPKQHDGKWLTVVQRGTWGTPRYQDLWQQQDPPKALQPPFPGPPARAPESYPAQP